MQAYKLTRPDGRSFHDGRTKWQVGKTVRIWRKASRRARLCGPGILHACPNPNDCFVGASIPCRAFLVEGEPVTDDGSKFGFHALKVVDEITDLDALFGWRYSEAINPVHPFRLPSPQVGEDELALLREWDSVWASVRDSVRDSVWAYIGSLFPDIKRWGYLKTSTGSYPFASGEKLWRMGLVPSFDGKLWRLHGGSDGRVLWQGIP